MGEKGEGEEDWCLQTERSKEEGGKCLLDVAIDTLTSTVGQNWPHKQSCSRDQPRQQQTQSITQNTHWPYWTVHKLLHYSFSSQLHWKRWCRQSQYFNKWASRISVIVIDQKSKVLFCSPIHQTLETYKISFFCYIFDFSSGSNMEKTFGPNNLFHILNNKYSSLSFS